MSASPALGGPVRLGDESAPFAGWSVETFPGIEDVSFDSLSESRPVRCTLPVVDDDSMPDFHLDVSSADLLPPEDFDGSVRLIDDVMDCGSTTGDVTSGEDRPVAPEPGSRLRSVVQTLAILLALVAVIGLGGLVAVVARRAGRASRGLRWYR